jgi:hypothetical protein
MIQRTLMVAIAAVVCAVFSAHAQETDIHWHHLYDDALKEASETGKPLFVAFRCVP